MANITFNRVANGEFQVLNNGVATEYMIVNGCLGMSGSGQNVYLISVGGEVKQTGLTLAKAKKIVAMWVAKASAKAEVLDAAGWIADETDPTGEIKDAALFTK